MNGSCAPVAIIPARVQSSRFPGKVLARLHGKPMIQWVWESACRAERIERVLVATGDPEVAQAVQKFGGEVAWTPVELPSGTDRVAYVAKDLKAEIIVNLQADEPLLPPQSLDRLVAALQNSPEWDMATLGVRLSDERLLQDFDTVKVVVSRNHEALYFSRAPLAASVDREFHKHIGIYGFRRSALLRFCDWPPGNLEKAERLEQLRALENGMRIRVILQPEDTIAVDRPEDLRRVEQYLAGQFSTEKIDAIPKGSS